MLRQQVLNLQERKMQKITSSDVTNHEMLADQTFRNILDGIQRSNLNFQLQVSPFSAYISLRKSFVKDLSGAVLLPPPQATIQHPLPSPTSHTDVANYLVRINELEKDLLAQKDNHEDVENKYKDALEKFEKENKALKQENKSLTEKFDSKTLQINPLRASVTDLNKEKNVLSVALKSVKQDLKAHSKSSDQKITEYEKKLSELNEFKQKTLNQARKERLEKKKELRKEAKKCSNNNKKSVKDAFAGKEEYFDENYVEKLSEPDNSGQQVRTELNDSCLSTRDTEPDANQTHLQSSGNTSENKPREIELEQKEEGFIGPRLPRMLTDEEVKAVFDRLLGDKYK